MLVTLLNPPPSFPTFYVDCYAKDNATQNSSPNELEMLHWPTRCVHFPTRSFHFLTRAFLLSDSRSYMAGLFAITFIEQTVGHDSSPRPDSSLAKVTNTRMSTRAPSARTGRRSTRLYEKMQ